MDFRPVDTSKTVGTRNLIRVYAITNIFLALIYTAIEPYFNGVHMSWIHQIHFILQPIAIFASVADSSIFTSITMFFSLTAILFDAIVLWLNAVAVNRCLSEPTATCFEMVWEKGIWGLLALIHVLSDVMLTVRLWTLKKLMTKKDITEKHSREEYESEAIKSAPDMNTAKVYFAKMRIIHLFLIPIGFIYVFFMLGRAWSNILWIGALLHVFVDIYGASVGVVHDMWSLGFLAAFVIAMTGVNAFVLVYRLPESRETISEDLSFYLNFIYLFADILLTYFILDAFVLLQKFEKMKYQ